MYLIKLFCPSGSVVDRERGDGGGVDREGHLGVLGWYFAAYTGVICVAEGFHIRVISYVYRKDGFFIDYLNTEVEQRVFAVERCIGVI